MHCVWREAGKASTTEPGKSGSPDIAEDCVVSLPCSDYYSRPMDILYLLIPLSLVLVFAIGAVFWWALRSGQFEDMEGPAHRILMDDDETPPRK